MQIEDILTHVPIRIIKLYYNNGDYISNITGFTKELDVSYPIARKYLNLLASAGILKEVNIGKSRIFKLNKDNPYTKAFIIFFDKCKEIEKKKG